MSTPTGRPRPYLLSRGSWPEVRRIGDILRTETSTSSPSTSAGCSAAGSPRATWYALIALAAADTTLRDQLLDELRARPAGG